MLEILQFIFSGFWIWLGTVVLLSLIATAVANFRLVSWKYVLKAPEEKLLREMIADQVKKQLKITVNENVKAIAQIVADISKSSSAHKKE